MLTNQHVIDSVCRWVESAVIGLELCPFARAIFQRQLIRYVVSESLDIDSLMQELYKEIRFLEDDDSLETTLIIIPFQLEHFFEFNQTLDNVDLLLDEYNWRGIFQIASFHPDYQFDSTDKDDIENWTNRSPYPVFHILRESSVEQAMSSYPEVERIPEKNVQRLRKLGRERVNQIFNDIKNKNA